MRRLTTCEESDCRPSESRTPTTRNRREYKGNDNSNDNTHRGEAERAENYLGNGKNDSGQWPVVSHGKSNDNQIPCALAVERRVRGAF